MPATAWVPSYLLWSWVWTQTSVVAKWMDFTGAEDGETPGSTILGAGRHEHDERSSREMVVWLVVVESSE